MTETAPETDAETETPDPDRAEKTGLLRRWAEQRAVKRQDRGDRQARNRVSKEDRATYNIAVALAAAKDRSTTDTSLPQTVTDLAPIPNRMRWFGVWMDRTVGILPLAAPLLVSGYYTVEVFHSAPLKAPMVVAVLVTLALEGGVWKLARLLEKTLVAGDSTIALRAGIGLYLAVISGLITWHADQTKTAQWPAFAVAIMSALGVYIWSRTARWQRRTELRAGGRIDRQAPKFAAMAWLLTPLETPAALRHAVKYRIESPVLAIEDRRLFVAAGKPKLWPPLPVPVVEPTPLRSVETEERAAPRPAPVAVSKPAAKQPVKRFGVVGRPTHEDYAEMVRTYYKDWDDPRRETGPLSYPEIKTATKLVGKETIKSIRRLLYPGLYAETVVADETGSDDSEEDHREPVLIGAVS